MFDHNTATQFATLGTKARDVYNRLLWNGRYFNLDNSRSGHHDSIMADMLAGHFFALACDLPPVASSERAISCYEEIFVSNVLSFGDGKLKGAVNGMRPGSRSAGAVEKPTVDNSCLQSREVWTGTTYALAAGMLLEAHRLISGGDLDGSGEGGSGRRESQVSFTPIEVVLGESGGIAGGRSGSFPAPALAPRSSPPPRRPVAEDAVGTDRKSKAEELIRMAMSTAQGIHDAGWQEFGYWFATPEAWEANGNYRSLGYMRPLAIWAMHFALEKMKTGKAKESAAEV